MDISSTLQPNNAFIFTNDDASRAANKASSNTNNSNANNVNATQKNASSIEPEWLDLTKTADSTYSYVDSKVASNSEPAGWTYDMAGRLNEVAVAEDHSRSSLIDVWA